MSGTFDRDPAPPPFVGRTGGGRTAWLVAVGLLAVLAAVVYVGLSGPSRAPGASSAPALAARTAKPSSVPRPSAGLQSVPPYQYLGAGLLFNGQEYVAALNKSGSLYYSTTYDVPLPTASHEASLAVSNVTTTYSHDLFDPLGRWSFSLAGQKGVSGSSSVVLDVGRNPDLAAPTDTAFETIVHNGYQLKVTVSRSGGRGTLKVELRVNPDPDSAYSLMGT